MPTKFEANLHWIENRKLIFGINWMKTEKNEGMPKGFGNGQHNLVCHFALMED
jgi:hypothetical protein